MNGLREFFDSPKGKVVAGIVVVAGLVFVFISVRSTFTSEASRMSTERMYIDAKTGKAFEHTISLGEKSPVKAPSGENTGYPGEPCFWKEDGSTKQEPTWVLLNVYVGKPGPTFCPDCKRLVVGHNPPPTPGAKPPPTESEYKNRKIEE
jgi:hypothetical protein